MTDRWNVWRRYGWWWAAVTADDATLLWPPMRGFPTWREAFAYADAMARAAA